MNSEAFRTSLRNRPNSRSKASNVINMVILSVMDLVVISVAIVDDNTMLQVLRANEDMDPVFAMGNSTYVMGCSPSETHQLYVDYCESVNNSTMVSVDKFIEAFENAL